MYDPLVRRVLSIVTLCLEIDHLLSPGGCEVLNFTIL